MITLAQETNSLTDLLDSRENIAPLFPLEILATPPVRFDLSRHNPALRDLSFDVLERHVSESLARTGFLWGYGGWGEERPAYAASHLSTLGPHSHVIHLGLDIWLPPGTPLYMPMTGTVHSFGDNAGKRTNGPTLISEHAIGDLVFYVLFSHLSRASLTHVREGKKLRYGDTLGWVGDRSENGSSPPHVHVQIIADMQKKRADFVGAALPSERERMLALCPDPEVLLRPFLVA